MNALAAIPGGHLIASRLVGVRFDQESTEDAEDLALQKKGKGKGFKGARFNCGKPGHRAADCWSKGGGKEGNPTGKNGSYGKEKEET